MKKSFLRPSLIFAFAGCFFLQLTSQPLAGQSKSEATEPNQKLTCNHPKFKNKSIIGICQQGHSCKQWTYTSNKQNGVRFDVGSECSGLYNFIWGPCRYIVYKSTGTSGSYEIYQKVDDITCNKNKKVTIAGSYFPNNTKCLIILYETAPSTVYNTIYYNSSSGTYCSNTGGTLIVTTGMSDNWRFTTLSFKGVSCGIESK